MDALSPVITSNDEAAREPKIPAQKFVAHPDPRVSARQFLATTTIATAILPTRTVAPVNPNPKSNCSCSISSNAWAGGPDRCADACDGVPPSVATLDLSSSLPLSTFSNFGTTVHFSSSSCLSVWAHYRSSVASGPSGSGPGGRQRLRSCAMASTDGANPAPGRCACTDGRITCAVRLVVTGRTVEEDASGAVTTDLGGVTIPASPVRPVAAAPAAAPATAVLPEAAPEPPGSDEGMRPNGRGCQDPYSLEGNGGVGGEVMPRGPAEPPQTPPLAPGSGRWLLAEAAVAIAGLDAADRAALSALERTPPVARAVAASGGARALASVPTAAVHDIGASVYGARRRRDVRGGGGRCFTWTAVEPEAAAAVEQQAGGTAGPAERKRRSYLRDTSSRSGGGDSFRRPPRRANPPPAPRPSRRAVRLYGDGGGTGPEAQGDGAATSGDGAADAGLRDVEWAMEAAAEEPLFSTWSSDLPLRLYSVRLAPPAAGAAAAAAPPPPPPCTNSAAGCLPPAAKEPTDSPNAQLDGAGPLGNVYARRIDPTRPRPRACGTGYTAAAQAPPLGLGTGTGVWMASGAMQAVPMSGWSDSCWPGVDTPRRRRGAATGVAFATAVAYAASGSAGGGAGGGGGGPWRRRRLRAAVGDGDGGGWGTPGAGVWCGRRPPRGRSYGGGPTYERYDGYDEDDDDDSIVLVGSCMGVQPVDLALETCGVRHVRKRCDGYDSKEDGRAVPAGSAGRGLCPQGGREALGWKQLMSGAAATASEQQTAAWPADAVIDVRLRGEKQQLMPPTRQAQQQRARTTAAISAAQLWLANRGRGDGCGGSGSGSFGGGGLGWRIPSRGGADPVLHAGQLTLGAERNLDDDDPWVSEDEWQAERGLPSQSQAAAAAASSFALGIGGPLLDLPSGFQMALAALEGRGMTHGSGFESAVESAGEAGGDGERERGVAAAAGGGGRGAGVRRGRRFAAMREAWAALRAGVAGVARGLAGCYVPAPGANKAW